MRRMIRSYRTRTNVRRTSALREQFMRELKREADALLKQLNDQFTQSLQTQLSQFSQSIIGNGRDTPTIDNNPREPGSIANIGQLLSTGVRYLVSRPRTSRDTTESSRSIDANATFRLSQSQAAHEIQTLLSKAEKNS